MKTIFLIVTILTLVNCNNNDDGFTPTLPEATQTGKNTFGCYINGKLLTPRDGTGTFNSADRGMKYSGLGEGPNYLYNELKVRDFKSGTGGLLKLHLTELHQNGIGYFIINESNCEGQLEANQTINITVRCWNENTNSFEWFCSVQDTGTINISRYDFENRIISGTFSCSAKNKDDSNDIIEITDGRFDIKWDSIPSFP